MKLCLLCITSILLIAAGYAQNSDYLPFIKQNSTFLGPIGSHNSGEIEIVTDSARIPQIEERAKKRLLLAGYNEEHAIKYSRVGIIAEDNYWIWIRDAVIFPSGEEGTYDRMIWRSTIDGPQGVAILPITRDGRIATLVKYRHATRSWEIEMPSGTPIGDESPEIAAQRKCHEETGFQLENLTRLGELAPDSGMTASVISVYTGTVSTSKLSNPAYSKAIHKIMLLNRKELLDGFEKGFIHITVDSRKVQAACRDSSLAYALLRTST